MYVEETYLVIRGDLVVLLVQPEQAGQLRSDVLQSMKQETAVISHRDEVLVWDEFGS